MFSGLSYLGRHGAYTNGDFFSIIPEEKNLEKFIAGKQILAKNLADAAFCFNAYDKHHSLYLKFGVDPDSIENNLKFYNLGARDITLFDAVGAKQCGCGYDCEL